MKTAIKRGELSIDVAVYTIAILVFIVTLYPILFVFFMSISTPGAVSSNEVMFLPDGIYLSSYKEILQKQEIWRYYFNTIFIVVIGTITNLLMTLLAGYVLSRRDFKLRNHLMIFVVLTMFFSGGLIPFYIQVRRLGLIGSRWALILPFALNAWNVIIMRTFLKMAIPEELYEAATIDGATKLQILTRIVAPLAKPVLAVIGAWSIAGLWNTYFWAMIFLPDSKKQPIQMFLMKVLVQGRGRDAGLAAGLDMIDQIGVAEQMKFVVIILGILPIIMLYPWLQKYFIKGVMLGSLKG